MSKFLVDRMLGQTAKWLRLLGIDAEYAPEGDDEKLLKLAQDENRIIITRDKELGREDDVILVEKEPPENIIKDVLSEYKVEVEPLTRCAKCNTPVEKIDEEKAEGEVPEGVYERHDEFWFCPGCGQYYWKGSHWDDIMEKVEEMIAGLDV
ncbi:MAG: Mut7-C RNAse domain-containing protein [Candidatus Aenigmatarchaeota archaeon]